MRRLQEETELGGNGGSASECSWDGEDMNGLGALDFIGNLGLVFGALLLIFLLHVALVSAVEAFWLAKVRVGRGYSSRHAYISLPSHGRLYQDSNAWPPSSASRPTSLIAARLRG